MDRFLLANNPLSPDSKSCVIIHTVPPVCIIDVQPGHIDKKPLRMHFTNKDAQNSEGLWTLSIHFMQDPPTLDGGVVDAILNRAWRWYRSYLERK